jgi:hypothetical protein
MLQIADVESFKPMRFGLPLAQGLRPTPSLNRPAVEPYQVDNATILDALLCAVMVTLAQRLPVGFVPEDRLISLVRDYVIYNSSLDRLALLGTHHTTWM